MCVSREAELERVFLSFDKAEGLWSNAGCQGTAFLDPQSSDKISSERHKLW
jgi:hypothetical protein